MSLKPQDFRLAMRAWTSGITIVTASDSGQSHGMTVNSFTSLSAEPPQILISLQTASRTCGLILKSGALGVTILSTDQKETAERFAGLIADADDRMAGIKVHTLQSNAPLLDGGLAWFDCRVDKTISAGTNTLIIADVAAVEVGPGKRPLVYSDRDYYQLKT
ncbi:MAG: flavin reductase [Anaerolineales bacterium]|nr:flavin reductase [Anaerolineales bacterium]